MLLQRLILLWLQAADSQAIVAVEAKVGWEVLQLGEEEQAHQVAGLGAIPAAHADVKTLITLLDPGCAPVEEEGVLGYMEELPVRLADGDQVGRPVEGPVKQLWRDARVIGVDVKLEEAESLLLLQGLEPTDGCVGVLPLDEAGLGADLGVQLLQLDLADPTEMIFGRVDEAGLCVI